MFRKLVIAFILVGSLQVWSLKALGSAVRLFNLAAIAVMIAVIVINIIYGDGKSLKKNFTSPLWLIFTAVLLSMFTAFLAFRQSFAISIYAQRDIYFYLFYFTLHALKIDKKELQRIIIYFGLIYVVLYLLQYFAYPAQIFDVPARLDRNTIRVYLDGLGYAMVAYFMCLHIFYYTNKPKYLILALIFFLPVVLFGARSGISTMMLGTIVQLLFSKRIKSKALITTLVVASLVPAFFFFQSIFEGIIQTTIEESANVSENVRIMAIQYYLFNFIPDGFAYFTGIGAPSERSPLGTLTAALSSEYGYFLSDIGIIANYVTYGVLFVLAIVVIIYKTLSIKIKSDMKYLRFFLIFEAYMMLPIAAGFAYSASIVVFCCIFYLLDISAYEYKLDPGD